MTSGQQDQAEHRQWDLNSAMHSGRIGREEGQARSGCEDLVWLELERLLEEMTFPAKGQAA